ncbi:NUDIX hydrolase [Thermosulfurimonas marina]|uniref:NUDIX hydrolase n=1 Tax=Thermosulfurimonas marina TaxID=2047767 RepID=A0A6H1WRU3_9BACT|nr:NUDIX hydrolase [Thermosulfurimonas marina]QJA05913.1 NUDIX hydrolase [Thermosulfurimonas marina]
MKTHLLCPHCGKEVEKYRNPFPTVDLIIETPGGIVLVRRKNPPYGWALPGGFVDYGESLEEAALREAQEETGLSVTLLCQFYTYSRPGRDPRFHTITTVYVARAEGEPRGGDDAAEARAFAVEELPWSELAFDHGEILRDYLEIRDAAGRIGKPSSPTKVPRC